MDASDRLKFLTLDLFLYDLSEKVNRDQLPPEGVLEPPLDGYIRYQSIQDSQTVQIDCSGEKSESKSIDKLREIQAEIHQLTDPKLGKVGRSWLLWGQLSSNSQNPLEIARASSLQLKFRDRIPNWKSDCIADSRLAGATLYELWYPPNSDALEDSYHLIICLFDSNIPYDRLKDTVAQLLKQLLYLCLYRNKIVWAYLQSRQLRQKLQQPSRMVPKVTNESLAKLECDRVNLQQLQDYLTNSLKILAVYATHLNYLEEQRHTIETNLENYQKRIDQIAALEDRERARFFDQFRNLLETNDNFILFDRFRDFAETKYLQQVQRDYTSLSPGLTLIENSIKAIESINQIEQTRSDRRLNNTVTVASFGVATSAVVAAVVVVQPPPNQPHFRLKSIGLSLGCGAVVALVAWGMLQIPWRRIWRR